MVEGMNMVIIHAFSLPMHYGIINIRDKSGKGRLW